MLTNIICKIKNFFINLFKWIKDECKDRRTLYVFIFVTIIIYFPVWGGYLIYFIFKWKWSLAIASFFLAFWAGPITPFFPLALAITLSIKKVLEVKDSKKNIKNKRRQQ